MLMANEDSNNQVSDIHFLHMKRDNFIKNTIVEKVLEGNAESYYSFVESKPEQLQILETVFTHPDCYPSSEILIKYKGELIGRTVLTYTYS